MSLLAQVIPGTNSDTGAVKITGLDAVVYGSENVADATRFFDDWGLTQVESGKHGADFSLPDGSAISIRPMDDPTLPAAVVTGSTVRNIVWGVDSAESLAEVAAELARDREVTEQADGTLCTRDENNYPISFRVTTTHALEAKPRDANSIGIADRKDKRAEAAFTCRISPQRMVHAVLWTPWALDAQVEFYVERLGFRPSDYVENVGAFVRASGAHDHHSLFLQSKGLNFGFQHLAFEVRDVDEVMMLGQYMESRGWKSHLGPGRHVMGSNIYWYFWCGAGGVVEVGCDMDHLTDHWLPNHFDKVPHSGSSWWVRPADDGLRPGHGDDWPQYQGRQT